MLYPQTSVLSQPRSLDRSTDQAWTMNDAALDYPSADKAPEASKGGGQHFTGVSSNIPAHPSRECRRVRWENTSRSVFEPTQAIGSSSGILLSDCLSIFRRAGRLA